MALLSFLLPGFVIDAVRRVQAELIIEAPAARPSARCPRCHWLSSRVHSRYIRSPRDLPVSHQWGPLRLQGRRFCCERSTCSQRTFAERLSELVPVHARRSACLTQALADLGFALGGRGGLGSLIACTSAPATDLREALERVLDRLHPHLRVLARALPSGVHETTSPQVVPVRTRRRSANEDVVRPARRARRHACYQAVRTLYAQGKSRRQIAAALPLRRRLARRFVQADALPERAPTRSRPRKLIRFEAYLQERWQAGARNTLALWRMVQHRG